MKNEIHHADSDSSIHSLSLAEMNKKSLGLFELGCLSELQRSYYAIIIALVAKFLFIWWFSFYFCELLEPGIISVTVPRDFS